MSISARERRLLTLLIPSVLVVLFLRYVVLNDPAPVPQAGANNVAMAEQRLERLRRLVAVLPTREAVMKQASADLAERERGVIQAATAAQAQATLLEVARRVGKTEQIDVRGGDLGAPKSFGDYGMVYATIVFECHIEQLVNFLADLSHQPELVVPSEERISTNSNKEKLTSVRMVLAGVVPKKLVPEKKGLGAF